MITSLRLYALIAGTVVVGLAARYGWISADASTDKAITAVMLATVALAGLCGHAVAVRVARASWSAGALVAMVSIAAVLVSLGTSIGSIATRGDALAAERGRLASTGEAVRNELIRLNVEQNGISLIALA